MATLQRPIRDSSEFPRQIITLLKASHSLAFQQSCLITSFWYSVSYSHLCHSICALQMNLFLSAWKIYDFTRLLGVSWRDFAFWAFYVHATKVDSNCENTRHFSTILATVEWWLLIKTRIFRVFERFILSINNIQTGGQCQSIAKQAMSKQVWTKCKIKGVTMATSHGSPPPDTCYTELSVKNK